MHRVRRVIVGRSVGVEGAGASIPFHNNAPGQRERGRALRTKAFSIAAWVGVQHQWTRHGRNLNFSHWPALAPNTHQRDTHTHSLGSSTQRRSNWAGAPNPRFLGVQAGCVERGVAGVRLAIRSVTSLSPISWREPWQGLSTLLRNNLGPGGDVASPDDATIDLPLAVLSSASEVASEYSMYRPFRDPLPGHLNPCRQRFNTAPRSCVARKRATK